MIRDAIKKLVGVADLENQVAAAGLFGGIAHVAHACAWAFLWVKAAETQNEVRRLEGKVAALQTEMEAAVSLVTSLRRDVTEVQDNPVLAHARAWEKVRRAEQALRDAQREADRAASRMPPQGNGKSAQV